MKQEFKRIKKVGKEIVGKKHYRKIRKLKNYEDKTESLKYLASSELHNALTDLEIKINELEHEKKKLIELKLKILPAKIKIFKSTFSARDYEVIKRMIKEIEGELKDD